MTRMPLVFRPNPTLSMALAGIVVTLSACGSDASSSNTPMPTDTVTAPASTTAAPDLQPSTPPATTAPPTVPSVAPPATSEVTPSVPPTTPTPTPTVSTTSEPGPTNDESGFDDSSARDNDDSTSSAPADSSAVVTEAPVDEDYDPKPEDFVCISDWEQISGFRIHNFLGHVEEAKAVANNPAGGVYPVGTVLQHLPTEAMVKRRAGFSPETKDWEFFLLTLGADGTTTISERGPNLLTMQGQSCPSCHSKAADAYDFVCNTWADHGGAGNCGFDFMQSFLDQQLATDTRCK